MRIIRSSIGGVVGGNCGIFFVVGGAGSYNEFRFKFSFYYFSVVLYYVRV